MHRARIVLALALLAGTGMLGCSSTEQQIRPEKVPEEFRAPPENDSVYSKPLTYPKESMEEDMVLKKARDAAKGVGPSAPRNTGMGMPGRPGM